MVHKWFSWLVKQSKSHRGVLWKILMENLNLKDVAPILKKARGIYHRFHSLWFITTVTFRIHWHIVDFVHWHIVQHIVQLYSILYIHLYSMCTCTAYCTLVQHVHLYSTLYTCTACALVQHIAHLYSIPRLEIKKAMLALLLLSKYNIHTRLVLLWRLFCFMLSKKIIRQALIAQIKHFPLKRDR